MTKILFGCGLRPEECFRPKWENYRDGLIVIHKGKGRGSRRTIPVSQRVQGILEMQKGTSSTDWIFPAPTASGHIEASSLKKQHASALKYMDPFTLHVLAGHTDMDTTKRYVHPDEAHIREAMSKVWGGIVLRIAIKTTIPGQIPNPL